MAYVLETRLELGLPVCVTGDAELLERECRASGLEWPDGGDGLPRISKLGMRGYIGDLDFSDNTAEISEAVGWLPIRALAGFESWTRQPAGSSSDSEDDCAAQGPYLPPEPASRGPAPPGTRLEERPHCGELLVADRDFQPGELVVRERFLLLGPPTLPPLSMFRAVPEAIGSVKMEGVGFPGTCTWDAQHLKLLFAFINADRQVQAEVLRMQDDMSPWSECSKAIEKVATWLSEQRLPWLEHVEYDMLFRLLRLFCVNSYPCGSAGKTSGLLKWGTMINHSCCPNVTFSSAKVGEDFEGHYRATRKILAGDVLGSSYMKPYVLLASIAQRRRMLWFLKGFICLCDRCCHELARPDRARALNCVECNAPCKLNWQYCPGNGNFRFIGTRCGTALKHDAEEKEKQLAGAVIEANFVKWRDLPQAIATTKDLVQALHSELHVDHYARWIMELLFLALESTSFCQGSQGLEVARIPESWPDRVQTLLRWLRDTSCAPHASSLLMMAHGSLAEPILRSLTGFRESCADVEELRIAAERRCALDAAAECWAREAEEGRVERCAWP